MITSKYLNGQLDISASLYANEFIFYLSPFLPIQHYPTTYRGGSIEGGGGGKGRGRGFVLTEHCNYFLLQSLSCFINVIICLLIRYCLHNSYYNQSCAEN